MERDEKNAGYKSHVCEMASYCQSTSQSIDECPTKERRGEKKRKP